MPFKIGEILDKFAESTRFKALLVLVIAVAVIMLGNKYLSSDRYSCNDIIKENFALHEDFAKISKLARELQQVNIYKQEVAQQSLEPIKRYPKLEHPDSLFRPMPPPPTVSRIETTVLQVEEDILEKMIKITNDKSGGGN